MVLLRCTCIFKNCPLFFHFFQQCARSFFCLNFHSVLTYSYRLHATVQLRNNLLFFMFRFTMSNRIFNIYRIITYGDGVSSIFHLQKETEQSAFLSFDETSRFHKIITFWFSKTFEIDICTATIKSISNLR